ACRSLWHGFVEWKRGEREDGMDSYGKPIETQWPQLCVGLLCFDTQRKKVSSRQGMQSTQFSSPFYAQWPKQVEESLSLVKTAIEKKDFLAMATAAEQNALAMHACMLTSR